MSVGLSDGLIGADYEVQSCLLIVYQLKLHPLKKFPVSGLAYILNQAGTDSGC